MKHLFAPLVAVLAVQCPDAFGDPCIGLLTRRQEPQGLIENLKAMLPTVPSTCSSYVSVAKTLIDGRKRGGRKLKDEESFNPARAQQDLEKALADPVVQEQLAQAKPQIIDNEFWLYYQATVFDAEGYYDARDLRISELQANSQ